MRFFHLQKATFCKWNWGELFTGFRGKWGRWILWNMNLYPKYIMYRLIIIWRNILQGLCFHIRCTLVSESGSITESMILRRFFIIRMGLRFFWKNSQILWRVSCCWKSGASGCIASIFPSEYLGRSKVYKWYWRGKKYKERNKRNHRWRTTEIGPAGKHRQ